MKYANKVSLSTARADEPLRRALGIIKHTEPGNQSQAYHAVLERLLSARQRSIQFQLFQATQSAGLSLKPAPLLWESIV